MTAATGRADDGPARTAAPMRPISKTFRARQVASEMTNDGLAICGGRGHWWSQREAAHDKAATAEEAAAAAAPAVQLCARCPETGAEGRCALRATLDGYTGLAAGQAWVAGRPRPAGAPRSTPARPLAG
jgi:hypothetical protein